MMIRKKSNPWARAKYLYVLPLAAVTVAAFARPEISQPLDEISSVKVNDLSAVLETYADKNVSNPAEKTKLKMKVVDKKGAPIIAATVLVANTTNGTITDENGNGPVGSRHRPKHPGGLHRYEYGYHGSQGLPEKSRPDNCLD